MDNLLTVAPQTHRRTALLLASGATFLSFLDATITNIAVPAIGNDFDVDVASLSWVVSAYAITFAAFLAPAGAVADVIGRRRLFIAGLAVFVVSSLAVAVAPSIALLLVGRAVQGLGAALVVPASLGLLLAETPADRRTGAIGLWAAAGALAAALGPSLGGVGVDVLGWRSLFLVNVPLGVWLAVKARSIPDSSTPGRLPDLVGGLALVVSVGGIVFAVSEGPSRGWLDGLVLLGFVACVGATGLTVYRTRRHPRPTLDGRLFRNRALVTATVLSVCYGTILYPFMLVGVLFTVHVWGYGELRAGLAMTPTALATAFTAIAVGRLRRRPSPRALLVAGFLVLALTSIALAWTLTDRSAFLSLWLPAGLAAGVGTGMTTVAISAAGSLAVASTDFAAAIGIVMAARQVGGALGIGVMAAMLTHAPAEEGSAYATLYWALAAAAAGALVIVLATRLTRTSTTTPTRSPVSDEA